MDLESPSGSGQSASLDSELRVHPEVMNSPLTLKVTSLLLSEKVCLLLLSKLCKLTKELRKREHMKSLQLEVVFENLRVF